MTVNRNTLAEGLAAATGITEFSARAHVAYLVEALGRALVAGKRVELRNLGSFRVVTRGPRKGRNLQMPGAPLLDVPERRAVRFKLSSTVKAALNSKTGP